MQGKAIVPYAVFASAFCLIIIISSVFYHSPRVQDSDGGQQPSPPDLNPSPSNNSLSTNKLTFYGSSYIEVPASQTLNQDSFTVSFWVKRFSPSGTYEHIISRYSSSESGWVFDTADVARVGDDKIRFIVNNESGQERSTDVAELPLERWTHITGTFDGSALKLYVNGTLSSERKFSGEYDPALDVPLRFGSAASFVGNFWHGDLSDVYMFNRSLSAAEVDALHDGTAIPEGTVGHWKLDDRTDTIIPDSSGQGNHGTIHCVTLIEEEEAVQ